MEAKRPEFKMGEAHYFEKIINHVIKALKKNDIKGKYFKTHEEAVNWLMNKIPEGSGVGVGGSRTLLQTGTIDRLMEADKAGKIKFINRWREGITPKEERQTRYDNLSADIFLTSTNAITRDGKLINIDGQGNRVAAMIFGPGKVYFLVGRNKIVKDVEAGIERTRSVAAAKNAARYQFPSPCKETGICDEENWYQFDRLCGLLGIAQ